MQAISAHEGRNMFKKSMVVGCLLWLGFSALQAPARADEVWFNRYDINHDGRWTFDDFARANTGYYSIHTTEAPMARIELRRRFDTYAVAHPGYVTREEVRTFHDWE
jgi:hypothetical protein